MLFVPKRTLSIAGQRGKFSCGRRRTHAGVTGSRFFGGGPSLGIFAAESGRKPAGGLTTRGFAVEAPTGRRAWIVVQIGQIAMDVIYGR